MSFYECPFHKVTHPGDKREDFSQQVHNALLELTMSYSMRLYKEVKQGCHCPSNYDAFDAIWKEANGPNIVDSSGPTAS
jgi:hypothetical protein